MEFYVFSVCPEKNNVSYVVHLATLLNTDLCSSLKKSALEVFVKISAI